ncbi:MAG TPA: hypothetical protein VGF92_03930 [Stellaceae bacterium]
MKKASGGSRFYYLNERDHIIDAEWISGAEDAVAMALAAAKLLARRDSRGIEIWQGKRRVDIVKSCPAKASARHAA